MTATIPSPAQAAVRRLLKMSRAPRLRTMREFAEAEIVIPEGKHEGRRWRSDRQPWGGLWIDEVDSGRWPRVATTFCVQGGKTLHAWVIVILYYLFEHGESVICGLPTMDVAADKWREELLPVIERTRYRDLLPTRGKGSRGGQFESVKFRNGATLKFMSGRGGDEKRSAFTARVVVVTEADKMDEAGEASREADPLQQLEARTLSYRDDEKRIFLECTVSIEEGCIWQEVKHRGTDSRIACPCPHCGLYVTPEREHLVGWKEAETRLEARRNSEFCCPECGEIYTEDERVEMNRRGVLVHKGQEVTPDGRVVGEPMETDTFGFRGNAFNNLFWTPGMIGAAEWEARRSDDEENAERAMAQFWWTTPAAPSTLDVTPLDAETVRRRGVRRLEKGVVPADTQFLTIGMDLGKWNAHWVVSAWRSNQTGHVVDYGVLDVDTEQLESCERATLVALRQWHDRCEEGWRIEDAADRRLPEEVWIDSGYYLSQRAVYQFCRERNPKGGCKSHRYRPTKGYGASQEPKFRVYRAPTKKTGDVREIGDGFHIARLRAKKAWLVHLDANLWKTRVQQGLAMPLDQPGALTLFATDDPNEHLKFSKHMTAERPVEKFVRGVGTQTVWVQDSRNNHWLDALYASRIAAARLGWRTTTPAPIAPPDAESEPDESRAAAAVARADGWFARRRKGGR